MTETDLLLIHKVGGLTHQHWKAVLDNPNGSPKKLLEYGKRVYEHQIPAYQFSHRLHLGRKDWEPLSKEAIYPYSYIYYNGNKLETYTPYTSEADRILQEAKFFATLEAATSYKGSELKQYVDQYLIKTLFSNVSFEDVRWNPEEGRLVAIKITKINKRVVETRLSRRQKERVGRALREVRLRQQASGELEKIINTFVKPKVIEIGIGPVGDYISDFKAAYKCHILVNTHLTHREAGNGKHKLVATPVGYQNNDRS